MFLELLERTELSEHFNIPKVTFLVPSEDFFRSLSTEEFEALVRNPDAVAKALRFHTIKGVYTKKQLESGLELSTLDGEYAESEADPELGLLVNDLLVLEADIRSSNSMIHIVEDFLIEIDPTDQMPEDLDDDEDTDLDDERE